MDKVIVEMNREERDRSELDEGNYACNVRRRDRTNRKEDRSPE
jgi:hypothetical protein